MLVVDKLKKFKFYSIIGTFILVTASIVSIILPEHVGAASYTWDGGGTDGTCGGNAGDGNKWSCAANWSSDIVPVAGDNVTFNGTSTKNATVDTSFGGTITNLTISSGYTGTITLERSLAVNGPFTQSDGTLTAANQTLTFASTFTLNSGAIFTASSGTMSVANHFTINSGATFNHNSGTVSFSASTATIACNNSTFNLVTFTQTSGTKVVNSDCNLPVGNNPTIGTNSHLTLNGTLAGTGTLTTPTSGTTTLNSGSALSGFTAMNAPGPFTYNGGSFGSITSFTGSSSVTIAGTWNGSTFTTFSAASFSINSGGNFTAPLSMTVAGDFTINSGGTFNHNNGTLNFTTNGGNATITCNNSSFNLVTFTQTSGTKIVSSNCNLPVGNNPTIGTNSHLTLNGTLSGTGTLTTPTSGTTTMNSGSALSGFTTLNAVSTFTYNGGSFGSITSFISSSTLTIASTWDASSFSTFTVAGGFTLNSGANFTAPSGTLSVAGNFTINSGGTFNHNNGTLNFTTNGGNATITCNNSSFNLVTFTQTSGTKIVSSNCNLPVGNNPTIGTNSHLTLNGTLSGTGTLTTPTSGTTTMNSGSALSGFTAMNAVSTFTFNGGSFGSITSFTSSSAILITGTWNASTYTSMTTGSSFQLNSGGNFTSPNIAMSFPGFIMQAGSTFTASSGTTSFNNALTINGGTFNHNNGTVNFGGTANATLLCTGATFNLATFTHTGGTKTVSSNCTFPLGNNPTVSPGSNLTLNGTLTGTGTLNKAIGGTFTINSGGVVSGFTELFIQNLTINAGGSIGSGTVTNMHITSTLNSAIALDASAMTLDLNVVNITAGTFTSPSTMSLSGALSVSSGATFTAPSGNLVLPSTFTLNSGSTFNHNNGTIVFSGTASSTLSCGSKTFNSVSFSHTTGTKTISSDCTFPLGSNPTSTGPITLNGNLTGTNVLTVNGAFTMNTGSSINCFTSINANPFTYNGGNLGGCINSATRTWDGEGTDSTCGGNTGDGNKWSCAFNWTGDSVPTAMDLIVFDGTSTKNSKIDDDFQGSTIGFSINSGYTGTITQARSFTVNGLFTQSSGTFIGSNDSTNFKSTSTLNSPGVLSARSGTMTFTTTFTFNSGTFNGGTGNIIFSGSYTQGSGSTFNAGSGDILFSGAFTLNSGGIFIGNSGILTAQSTFVLNTGSIFTAPSATLNAASTFTINSGVTFNHNNGVVNFNGGIATITCNNAIFNLVTFTHTIPTKTVASSCTFPLGNNPKIPTTLTVNGTLTGSGTFEMLDGVLTLSSTANLSGFTGLIFAQFTHNGGNMGSITSITTNANSFLTVGGTWNASAFTTFEANAFTLNAAAVFTAPAGTMQIRSQLTVNSGATFNHNNGTVEFAGRVSGILSCNNITFNLVKFTHTAATKTINSNCTFPLGNNPILGSTGAPASIILNGALTGTGSLTVNGSFTMNSGSSINCFSSINANPFIYNGGSLGCITSLTHTWDGGGTDGTCGGNAGDGNNWSCGLNWSTDSIPGQYDSVVFDSTSTKNAIIDSTFSGNILNFTVSSSYTGTITQQRSLSLIGSYSQSHGTFSGLNNNFTILGNFTLNSPAVFTAPSATLDISGAFIINSGSTYNHNNGTLNFNSIGNVATLSCNNTLFNQVTFDFSGVGDSMTRTVSANCSLPLGNNPVIESIIALNGTLSGSGTFYTGHLLTLNSGSQLSGFTGFDSITGPAANSFGSHMVVSSGHTFNASSYSTFVIGSVFNVQGVFTAPSTMSVGRGFTLGTTATFNHNNGTVIFTDPEVSTNENPAVNSDRVLLICASSTFNNVIFTHTMGLKVIRTFGGGGLCSLPLGNNPTINGPVAIGEAFGVTGALSGTGTLTFNSTVDQAGNQGTISGFDNVIFNNSYVSSGDGPIFSNVNKLTFNNPTTFNYTFNGSQVPEIEADDVIFSSGSFTAPTSLKVSGDWTKTNGTFNHNNGTVEFIETNDKTISGNTTFNNLKYAPSVDPTLSFEAGSTQTVLGNLTLKGQAGEPVFLKSTSAGQQWNIDAQGTYDVEFVNVSDSNSTGSTISVGCDSVDGGNNTNWTFGTGCSPAVLNLGPSSLTNGSTTSNNQPTFTFSIVDGDSWDKVKYTIEIDNDSDFSSPEVCYTSAFENTGNFSFTVGQSAGSGTYTCGESGQRLSNGSYYWRVSAVDLVGYSSGYEVANDGDIAFKVSVSLPVQIIEEIIDLIPDFDDEDDTIDPTLPETGSPESGEKPNPSENDKSGLVKGSAVLYIVAAVCSIPLGIIFIVMIIPILKKKRKKENAGS